MQLSDKFLGAVLVAAVLAAVAVFALTISGRFGREARAPEAAFAAAGAAFEIIGYSELSGWHLDRVEESLPALLRSCEKIAALAPNALANPDEFLGEGSPPNASLAGAASDWKSLCEEAARALTFPFADENAKTSAAKQFYEYNFTPVRLFQYEVPPPDLAAVGVAPRRQPLGRFTGYFEPFYDANPQRTPVFSAPLYARPDDLVTVDLGKFRPELSGQRIAGRVAEGALDPYPDHASINEGAISARARVLAWMRPTDLFFLQIQGSGRLRLPGGELRVGYDGANGRPYTAIGRTLISMGILTRENVSMQSIRDWLDKAPADAARKVRESNESYVFFRVIDGLPDERLGPLGAQGVQLTAGRSLAIDHRYVPFGAPVWISIEGKREEQREPIRRLLIAQDTGGAIKGAVRGDIFVGSGPLAGDVASGFNEMGEMIVLVPNSVAARLTTAPRS